MFSGSISWTVVQWGDSVVEFRGKRVVICFTTKPVSKNVFFASKNYLFGRNITIHSNMMLGDIGFGISEKVHLEDEYRDIIVWFKYLEDDRGLFGVDAYKFMEEANNLEDDFAEKLQNLLSKGIKYQF